MRDTIEVMVRLFAPRAVMLILIGSLNQPLRAESAMSDYATIPLDRLIGVAQAIVVGDVAAVKQGVFTFRVSEKLVGGVPGEIEVRQYTPSRFEGTARAAPYAPGQMFLLFLSEDAKSPGRWTVLGAGGEGEMPLEQGFVHFHGRTVEGLPFGRYTVHGAERKIQRFETASFLDAIRRYRECFEWKPGSDERSQPVRRCDGTALDAFARRSAIHSHLAGLTANRFRASPPKRPVA